MTILRVSVFSFLLLSGSACGDDVSVTEPCRKWRETITRNPNNPLYHADTVKVEGECLEPGRWVHDKTP